jgi:outer membrane protein
VRRRALQQIIGRMPDVLVRPNEVASDLLTLKHPRMEDWITLAEQNNLTLKIQQAIYNIAKQDVERA